MKIAEITSQDEVNFNELASQHGSIFNTYEWTSIFSDGLIRYGIYNKGGELIGGFITYTQNKLGLSFYRNPPYTPDVGPFLRIDACNPVSVMNIMKKTLSSVSDFLNKLPYSVISIALNKNILDMQPFIWDKFKVSPGYTYLLDLSLPVEDLWKRMSNERRKNITKGKKDGLYVKKINDYKLVRSLVLMTYSRQERKTNEQYLNKVLFEFANESNSFAYATYQGNTAIACSFCIFDQNTVYYLLGGYDHENKHHGAGTISMWEAINHSKNIGLKQFDFEGSMIPQIETYFRGFGGNLVAYYRVSKAKLPLEMLLKCIKRELF